MSRILRIACYVIALNLVLSIVSWFVQGRLWFVPIRVAVGQLEQTLPYLQQQELVSYRNQSWCKHLVYNQGLFSETTQPNTCKLFEGQAQSFTPEAQQTFYAIRQKMRSSGLRVAFIVSSQNPPRTEFHLNCWWCPRTRFVYEPAYQLPDTLENEIWYKPINQNWFQVSEDWN